MIWETTVKIISNAKCADGKNQPYKGKLLAFITEEGYVLQISESEEEFIGYYKQYSVIDLPWEGTAEDLKKQVSGSLKSPPNKPNLSSTPQEVESGSTSNGINVPKTPLGSFFHNSFTIFLNFVFQPREVKMTIAAIHAFFDRKKSGLSLSRDIIEMDAVSIAKKSGKTIESVRHNGKNPDESALRIITFVLANHLSSGNYHVHRGMLSMTGTDMLNVFRVAINELQTKGYYSGKEAEDDLFWLDGQIKDVG